MVDGKLQLKHVLAAKRKGVHCKSNVIIVLSAWWLIQLQNV